MNVSDLYTFKRIRKFNLDGFMRGDLVDTCAGRGEVVGFGILIPKVRVPGVYEVGREYPHLIVKVDGIELQFQPNDVQRVHS